MQNVKSEWCTLKNIVDHDSTEAWFFNVPLYQRLYVWGDEQISTLLNDIANACERQDAQFFLGGILVVETTTEEERRAKRRTFDLIDGQQRFTTLFLLSQSPGWRKELSTFGRVERNGGFTSRLNFSVRPDVNRYFEAMLQDPQNALATVPDTQCMQNARQVMTGFREKRALDEAGIGKISRYIYENVRFVRTEVPRRMDLNKLFEVINARGVQLQHHEILKARLLYAIPAEERQRYAALWDACADMKGFVDQTLRQGRDKLSGSALATLYTQQKLACAPSVRDLLARQEALQETDDSLSGYRSLAQIADADHEKTMQKEQVEGDDHWADSIIGFPLFLLHVLRIWLYENSRKDLDRILDRNLTKIFEEFFFSSETPQQQEQDAKGFVDLVWTIRVLWDATIIKWTEAEIRSESRPDRIHMLCKTSVSGERTTRNLTRSINYQENAELSLLQSMLYHTQENTTQYWMTPYLYYVYKNQNSPSDYYLKYLRHLDNYLLGEETDEPLVKRTRSFMEHPWRTGQLTNFAAYLRGKHGVHFRHYWFYKLDFVLWHSAQRSDAQEEWKNFRFTAKNSVEHISPQQPQPTDYNIVSPDNRDDFGNLVLLSGGINSEYSNRPFNEKKIKFENIKQHGRIESLKMDLIYQNAQWNDEVMERHRESMIKYLENYYREDI